MADSGRAWMDWVARAAGDLTQFVCRDVPQIRCEPWTYDSARLAELAVHRKFPEGTVSDLCWADRFDRYVGRLFINRLGVGDWVNAPDYIPGDRDADGVLPVVMMPYGEFITSLLPAVLAVPEGVRRGEILIEALEYQRQLCETWMTSGRPDNIADLWR